MSTAELWIKRPCRHGEVAMHRLPDGLCSGGSEDPLDLEMVWPEIVVKDGHGQEVIVPMNELIRGLLGFADFITAARAALDGLKGSS